MRKTDEERESPPQTANDMTATERSAWMTDLPRQVEELKRRLAALEAEAQKRRPSPY